MTHELNRRAVLRGSAMIAAPIAAVAAPAAAFAADDSAARLAQLQDRRAIEALHGRLMHRLAASGPAGARDMLPGASARSLGSDLGPIVALGEDEPAPELGRDGQSASLDTACRVERVVHHEGNTTIEKMARMQGSAAARTSETRLLRTRFARRTEGWEIVAVELA